MKLRNLHFQLLNTGNTCTVFFAATDIVETATHQNKRLASAKNSPF